jgi:protein SCO1
MPSPGRLQRVAGKLAGHPLFWVTLVLAITGFSVGRSLLIRLPPPLPVLGKVPDFELIDQTGEPFGTAAVRGKVWVAGMISISEPDADAVVGKLRTIQHRARNLGTSFRVVAVSADPEHDTPVKLAEFLRGRHTSPRLWSFLTGSPSDLAPLLRQFEAPPVPRASILLVDPELRIRARYRSDEPDVVEKVLRDVGLLANRGG